MKDTKHIRRIFFLSPGSCPRGGTWWWLGGQKIKFRLSPLCYLLLNQYQIWCVCYSHLWGVQQRKKFSPFPYGPEEGSKGQISLTSITKSISKILYQTFCILTNKIWNILNGILAWKPWSCPRGGTWGAGCAQGSKFSFLNMVMWHIKLKGIMSRTEWQ